VTADGSINPAIVGKVAVVSIVPVTYALEPGNTVPVAEPSSRTIESMYTSLPTSTSAVTNEDLKGRDNGSIIAGAVVGTFVGLTLSSLLVWFIFRGCRRKRSRDYLGQSRLHWKPWSVPGSRSGLDLNSEPRMQNSYVEPWVLPVTPAPAPSLLNGRERTSDLPEIVSGSRGHCVCGKLKKRVYALPIANFLAGCSRTPGPITKKSGLSRYHPSTARHYFPAPTRAKAGKSAVGP
jgi:hypothetical protein